MKNEIKIFAAVGTFATICVTLVSLYAISKGAEWANTGIIVGIAAATLTVVVPVAQYILVRFRSSPDGNREIDFEISKRGDVLNNDGPKTEVTHSKAKEKEAEKLLIQLILEQQSLFVRRSYGESATECFTWEDLDRFKQENNIAKIERNITESGKFDDLVDLLISLPDRRRNDIYQKGRYTFKRTWSELGEITADGQTDAGQKTEKMIADTIVALTREREQLTS